MSAQSFKSSRQKYGFDIPVFMLHLDLFTLHLDMFTAYHCHHRHYRRSSDVGLLVPTVPFLTAAEIPLTADIRQTASFRALVTRD